MRVRARAGCGVPPPSPSFFFGLPPPRRREPTPPLARVDDASSRAPAGSVTERGRAWVCARGFSRGRRRNPPLLSLFVGVFRLHTTKPTPDPDPAAPHPPQVKVQARACRHARPTVGSVGRRRRPAGGDKPKGSSENMFLLENGLLDSRALCVIWTLRSRSKRDGRSTGAFRHRTLRKRTAGAAS